MSKPRFICVINQKGGVGKTTTSVNLAAALALARKKVLMMDLDPQGHLTASYGLMAHEQSGMDEILLNGASPQSLVQNVRKNQWLIPAGSNLVEIEHRGTADAGVGETLKKAFGNALPDVDFIIVDCPPSAGALVTGALYVTDEVLIPVAGDYLSLHGLAHLMATLQNFEKSLKHELKPWFVVTKFHSRRRLSNDVRDKLIEHFPGRVLQTPIRENAALAECPSFGKTIFEYRKNSNGASDYRKLAQDLIKGKTAS